MIKDKFLLNLLEHGSTHLFHEPEDLNEMVGYLTQRNFKVHLFDCSSWSNTKMMGEDFDKKLDFDICCGGGLPSLEDCLRDVIISPEEGRVLVFKNFDIFFHQMPEYAWNVLDILELKSRDHLLYDQIFVMFLQSNDENLCAFSGSLKFIGGTRVNFRDISYLRKLALGKIN